MVFESEKSSNSEEKSLTQEEESDSKTLFYELLSEIRFT